MCAVRSGVHNGRPYGRMRSSLRIYAAVHMSANLKCQLWWPCLIKNSLSTVLECLVERQPNGHVCKQASLSVWKHNRGNAKKEKGWTLWRP